MGRDLRPAGRKDERSSKHVLIVECHHPRIISMNLKLPQADSKNPRFVLSTVATSTDLSRYLFPRSHEVSGKKRQAWQAALCNERSCRPVCSAQSGSDVQLRICSKAPS